LWCDFVPRAKPTEVIVHRIDMQPALKESVDAYLAANALTNALSAAGGLFTGVLAAFAPALGGIVAAMIAKEGIEEIASKVTNKFEEMGEAAAEPLREAGDYYQAIGRALAVHTGPLFKPEWEELLSNVYGRPLDTMNKDVKWVYDAAFPFWSITSTMSSTYVRGNSTPPPQGYFAPGFKAYFPVSRLKSYLLDAVKNPLSRHFSKGTKSTAQAKVLMWFEDAFLGE
jgi:hypothetical protein